MIWRLRLFLEKIGRKRLLAGVLVAVVLIAAGVAFAVIQSGGSKKAATTASSTEDYTNIFYLQGLAPKVRVRSCAMYIRFTWKPNYHANQYIDAPALILAAGTGIGGTYRKTFKASGMSLDVGPIRLGGGYQIWSAKVLSLDGDPPKNDTTIQAAAPASAKCG
ncbi:MAG: hypothetical protein ABI896_07980 [Actinomycetota bacterium]